MRTTEQHRYILGHSVAEHARLARQAALFEPYTERLFFAAGIAPGMRVLDVGCGVGDVSLLVARLVGPRGQVVGIDRDASAIATARERAVNMGYSHVRFELAAIEKLQPDTPFDAIVGRFVLMFAADPAAAIRNLARNLRRGGLLVLQEPIWSTFFAFTAALPLRDACASWIGKTMRSGGAEPDMGLELHRLFAEQGMSSPSMLIEIPTTPTDASPEWLVDLMTTLSLEVDQEDVISEIGCSLAELPARLDQEVRQGLGWRPMPALVGAWAHYR